MPTRRQKIHQATHREIIDLAWEQIAREGAPALSLRAIARQMGMTAPALYRYFENRDALVTELIVDAYHSLAAAQEQASSQASDPAGQLIALGHAYRTWALAHPQRYQLIFGTPIPGYQAPAEVTEPAARRSFMPLLRACAALLSVGNQPLGAQFTAPQPELAAQLVAWPPVASGELPPAALHLALLAWSRIHGLVSLELDRHLESLIGEAGALFSNEIHSLLPATR